MKRSFAALDPQEALHVAICIEQRNAEIYHRFAEMFVEFGDPESLEIAQVFWEMAVEERHHHAQLCARYSERYGRSSCILTEEELIELIEVPKIDSVEDFLGFAGADELGARGRALEVALHAEVSAQHFYVEL